ncbi:MAG: hypothetical protein NTU44_00105 [Bacteroidetes bacterium]|nr:hypothetical protein [Bacteroidota bacterium]
MKQKANDIQEVFKGKLSITSKELTSYFRMDSPLLSENSIRQRISRYKRAGTLVSIKNGVYAISGKTPYVPEGDSFMEKVVKIFRNAYPEINYCIWSSAWLNQLMIQQPSHYFYLLETEDDIVESAFHLLKDKEMNAWVNPGKNAIQLYVLGRKNAIIVKPLISRAPLKSIHNTRYPVLEKVLVDTFVEKQIFYFVQGQELANIFNFAFSNFSITYSKIISYARRRGIDKKIEKYIADTVNQNDIAYLND